MTKKEIKKQEQTQAMEQLEKYRNCPIGAIVNHVSASGMSRRIEYYTIADNRFIRIGYLIARTLDYPYDVDKGGIVVTGCGMDMIYHVLSNLNYRYATWKTGKTITELLESKEYGEHIYDNALFDADRYQRL